MSGTRRFRYNSKNLQTRVESEDGRVQENLYDAEGLRCGMREDGQFIRFVYHSGELLYEGGDNNQTSYHLGAGIEAFRRGGETYYYHQDEQLSTALVTGQAGKFQNHYQYDAFGNELEKEEQLANRIRYTGQQYDQVTGQYYLRARYYNPLLGRFMQEDVYQGDGLNLYAYCDNNPVMYYDPSGYDREEYEDAKTGDDQGKTEGAEGRISTKQANGIEEEIRTTTGGQKRGTDTLADNIVQRGITLEEAELIAQGQGIETPKPLHNTTPDQHIGGTLHSKDPWISTTRSSETAEYYATHDASGKLLSTPNPIIEIDLNKIDIQNILDVSTPDLAQQLRRPFCRNAAAHDQEVLIKFAIPIEAILKIIFLEF